MSNENEMDFEQAGRETLKQMAAGFAQKEEEIAKVRAEMTAQAKVAPPTEKELLTRLVALEEQKLAEAKNRELMANPAQMLASGFEQVAKERAERQKVEAEIGHRKTVAYAEESLRAALAQAGEAQARLAALKK